MVQESRKFDFIESAVHGYRMIWAERQHLLAIAFVPFAVKFLTYLAIVLLQVQDNYLRQGLLLVPSNIAEAWFIAYALRLTLLGESWPSLLTGDTKADKLLMARRKRALQGAIGIYVLIKLVSAFALGLGMAEYEVGQQLAQQGAAYEGSPMIVFGGLVLIAVSIWAFRYMWLYVPVALGHRMRDFLAAVPGFMGAFRLMAVWMICFTPLVLLLMVLADVLKMLFPAAELDIGHLLYVVVWSLVQSGSELFIALVVSLAVGRGFFDVIRGNGG